MLLYARYAYNEISKSENIRVDNGTIYNMIRSYSIASNKIQYTRDPRYNNVKLHNLVYIYIIYYNIGHRLFGHVRSVPE